MVSDDIHELQFQIYTDLSLILLGQDPFHLTQVCAFNLANSRITSNVSLKSYAVAKYAAITAMCGIQRFSLRYANQSLGYVREDFRPELTAFARSNVSASLYGGGRLDDAEIETLKAISVLDRCGDHHA